MKTNIPLPLRSGFPAPVGYDCSRLLLLVTTLALVAPGMAGARQATAATADTSGFTVVLLPDTQHYSEKYPEIYLVQTRWIAERAKPDNIKFAIHLGDIVQHWNTEEEWKVADRAQGALEGLVPYSMLPGNHDIGARGGRNTTLYNKYFSPARFKKYPWYGGHMDETNDNNYCFFEAAGMKFMVLSLEYCPRDETLRWADGILRKYRDRRVIVATHLYLKGVDLRGFGDVVRDNTIPLTSVKDNNGEEMWQKLIRKHANVFMVVCGHRNGFGVLSATNDSGGTVYELLTDSQDIREHGGDGWLTTLQFMPDEDRIYVRNYSPYLKQYNRDPVHQVRLIYAQETGSAVTSRGN